MHDLKYRGLDYPDRPEVFQKVLARFRERRMQRRKQAIMNEIQAAPDEGDGQDQHGEQDEERLLGAQVVVVLGAHADAAQARGKAPQPAGHRSRRCGGRRDGLFGHGVDVTTPMWLLRTRTFLVCRNR